MKCPSCESENIKVIDSRPVPENNSIRRRRECLDCKFRFTTYEVIDAFHPIVLKKNGTKEYFDKNKLMSGLFQACQKRPVDPEKIANEIEYDILNGLHREITSSEIGEMAMEKLLRLDDVAYVRFASVHREFRDVETFMREIERMKRRKSIGTSSRTAAKTAANVPVAKTKKKRV